MTAAAFQAAMVRLVIDRRFRRRVRRSATRALPGTLSSREAARLRVAASHPGLDITRMMYVSFRLSRLQAAVPCTFRLLARRLDAEVSRYLERCPPASFYFIDEGRGLLAHLRARMRDRKLLVPYLADVVAYEAGLLAMQEAQSRGVDTTVRIRVEHDIGAIVAALDAGKAPRRIRRQQEVIVGHVKDGQIQLISPRRADP